MHLFIVAPTQLAMVKHIFFVTAFEHLGIKPLVNFDNFSVLLLESNPFKFQLRESLLISRDKMILNKDKFSVPMKLFD